MADSVLSFSVKGQQCQHRSNWGVQARDLETTHYLTATERESLGDRTSSCPARLTLRPTSGHKPSRATAPDQRRTERGAPAVLFGNERDGKVGTFARARSLVEQASTPGVVTYATAVQQASSLVPRELPASAPTLPGRLASTSRAAC